MRFFVTGSAGFIGFHLSKVLLDEGHRVHGYDGLTDYYDVRLKNLRHGLLAQQSGFSHTVGMLEDAPKLYDAYVKSEADVVIHLAAQAGVRYSIESPDSYISSNIVGTHNVLEMCRSRPPQHLLMASTSSVYGANELQPFREVDKADTPLSLYAATKKANEAMGHSYAHLFGIPITMFRFFTVYGAYGRPDLALYKFVSSALKDEAIDVYNHGKMARDFTHVGDLAKAISLLCNHPPSSPNARSETTIPNDTLSPAAAFRIVNIGNSTKVRLLDFISSIEKAVGKPIQKRFLEMQAGDVPETLADTSLLRALTGFSPATNIDAGVAEFVDWYRQYTESKKS